MARTPGPSPNLGRGEHKGGLALESRKRQSEKRSGVTSPLPVLVEGPGVRATATALR